MMNSNMKEISVRYVSDVGTLGVVLHNIAGLPNNPPSLYLSTDSRNLIIYVEPISTVNIIEVTALQNAIIERHEYAIALKTILETGPTRKVFFDARTPAKHLLSSCNIQLTSDVRHLDHKIWGIS